MPGAVVETEMTVETPVVIKEKKSKKSKKVKTLEPEEVNDEIGMVEELDSGVAVTPKKVKKSKKDKKEKEVVEGEESPKKTKKRKQIEETPEPKTKKSKSEPTEEEEEKKVSTDEEVEEEMPFKEIWETISENTREKLKARGVTCLFPVQAECYKNVMNGEDVIVQSRTGSGKTFAFAIPIVEKLQADKERTRKRGRYPRTIIMAPTRELASQICRDINTIGTGVEACAVYGGVSYERQENMINKGTDIIVGTPGRMKDLLDKGKLNFSDIEIVALDEVDRMLDMGFAESVDECIGTCYQQSIKVQTLFFSATCPSWVKQTAAKYMQNVPPIINMVGRDENRTSKTVRHLAIQCRYHDWADVIGDLVTVFCGKQGRCIIFAGTKKDVSDLALSDTISDAQMIHGDIEQKTREQTLQAFRDGKMRILVATDVAARGLDIPEIDLVIQTGPPSDIDSYIHRSGRTGRAGRKGLCICLYKPQELYQLKQVERVAGCKFEMRGPIGPIELEEAAAKDVQRMLQKLPEKSGERFLEVAREMIAEAEENESSAEVILSKAIAIMSGVTDSSARSTLSGKKGFQTWQMDATFELRSTGFIYGLLEKSVGPKARGEAKGMRMKLDNTGGCFDLPSSMTEEIEKHWKDTETLTLIKCDKLPELAELKFSNERSGGGGGGRSYGGGRGGGRGRGGGGRGRGGGRGGGKPWERKKY